jgi:uncharacterized protein (TIGR02996 family)
MIEEQSFLAAILERPDDDSRKLVYADWLEEHGDPRAEYVRLVVKLRQQRLVTPEQRLQHEALSKELAQLRTQDAQALRANPQAWQENPERHRRIGELDRQLAMLSKKIRQPVPARLQELAATLDPNWLVVVNDAEIEGCRKSAGTEGWPLRFDFVCDKTWADLTPGDSATVRNCQTCRENVHYCDNLVEARTHAAEGHCIAVDLGIPRRENDLVPPVMFLGRPSAASVRKSYEEGVDPVSKARLAARQPLKAKRAKAR